MTRFDKYKYHGLKLSTVKRKDEDDVVKQGLAYTPADMENMLQHGMPINSANMAAQFYDGDDSPNISITSDREKGRDINDMWEEHQTITKKAKNAYKHSKNIVANSSKSE